MTKNAERIYPEVREICMAHLKVALSTRQEETTDELTQAITKTTYGRANLYWDNTLMSQSEEQVLSQVVELPTTGAAGGGMPGGF